MTGYGVDPEALRGAINKLRDTQQRAMQLANEADQLKPGELTAKDAATKQAWSALYERASGDSGSLLEFSQEIASKIEAKIKAYEDSLREYAAADENAFPGQRT